MIPCPKEVNNPAVFFFSPFAMVTAKSGPGAITPESDIRITDRRKRGKSEIGSMASFTYISDVTFAGTFLHELCEHLGSDSILFPCFP
jgi:hypothetical protein